MEGPDLDFLSWPVYWSITDSPQTYAEDDQQLTGVERLLATASQAGEAPRPGGQD